MATEVGTAYLSIVAATKGMTKDIKKAFGEAEADGEKSGKKSGSGFLKGIGGMVAKGAALLGVGAVVGTAITAGMNRAISIEGAQAKLKGLGHDTESVASIMKNALASVKGTSFGLGEAATTAAGAVAAGIKPGENLERVLKSAANAAAAAGVGMGEMGSIYNKVASLGKAQNDSLQQVADRGIPIYQKLAEQLGVTTDEVFKMASAGTIGFDQFEKAMTSASGTVADEMGQTFTGMLANTRAALGRLGAAVMTPGIAAAKPILAGIMAALDALTSRVGPLAAAFGEKLQPAAEAVGAAIQAIATGKPLTDLFGDAAPIAGVVSALSPLGLAIKTLQPVLPQFGAAFVEVVKALTPAVPALATVAATMGGALAQALATVVPAILPLVVKLAEMAGALASNEPLLWAVISAFAGFKTVSAVTSAVSATTKAVQTGVGAWSVFSTALGGAQRVAATGNAQMKALKIGMIAHKVAAGVATAAQWLWNAAMTANPIGIVIVAIGALVAALVWFFTQTDVGREAWSTFTSWLGDTWNTVAGWATDTWGGIADFFTGLWSNITGGAVSAWDSVASATTSAWASVTGAVSGAADAVVSGVTSAWSGLAGWATSTWQGIVSGIETVWGAVGPIITAPIRIAMEYFGAAVETIKALVAAGFLVLVGIFTGDGQLIADATNGLGAKLGEIWGSAWANIQGIVSGAWEALKGLFSVGWTAVSTATTQAWDALTAAVSTGITTAVDWVAGLPGRASDALSSLGSQITGVASSAWASFTSAVSAGADRAVGFARGLPGRAMSALSSLGSLIVGVARSAWSSFTGAVSSGIASVIDLVRSLPGRAMSALSSIGSALLGAGRQLIQGLINGITGAAGAIAGKVRDVIGGAIGAAKKALGIASPSKVFALIGKQTGQGLVVGLDGMVGRVSDAAAHMVEAAIPDGRDLFGQVTAGALDGLRTQVGMTVQAKYDAISTRIQLPDLAAATAHDRAEIQITNYGVDAAELAARQQAQLEHWSISQASSRR